MLANSLLTLLLLAVLQNTYYHPSQTARLWTFFLVFKFIFLVLISAQSLLSTAAVVFTTVASLYTSRPVSFLSNVFAIPKIYKRLFITFLWILLLMIGYTFVFGLSLFLLIIAIDTNTLLLFFAFTVLLVLFLAVHMYITALWHLASVVSILEADYYGFAAMKRSYELLKGRTKQAGFVVLFYLIFCGVIEGIFMVVVGHDGLHANWLTTIVVFLLLVGTLTVVNLVGFSVQSLFYYVCKSYHHEGIDMSVLHDHLGYCPCC